MDDIEKTIAVVNQMLADKVTENYALDTGRPKDYLRIALFLQHNVVDEAKLQSILTDYDLTQKWQENIHKFQP